MEQEHKTDRVLVKRGVTYMMIALPLLFLGPIVLHSSFKNQAHPLFIAVCGFGVLLCFTAMFFVYKGLKNIMNALFSH